MISIISFTSKEIVLQEEENFDCQANPGEMNGRGTWGEKLGRERETNRHVLDHILLMNACEKLKRILIFVTR